MLSNIFKPIDCVENYSSRTLYWWMLFMIVVKLWLVEAQDFLATYTPHDDYLFVKLAKHILSGTWLGPYDQVTLVKGPIYPLFIAAAHHTGMPLLLVQHLLYAAVCVVAIVALRPLIRAQWLLVLGFFFLLFNPFTYFYPGTGRAFRFGLSMPLVLALFSCMGALLIRYKYSLLNRTFWSVCAGVIFSLLWYTREEGIWLLPSIALFALYFLFIGENISFQKVLTRIALLLPILLVFTFFTTTFKQLNQKHYGAPYIIELKSPEFQSALGRLMNINVNETKRYIPVRIENQEAAYEVSPTFKQLQPYFEEAEKGSQLPRSFYIWVFRDMVRKSGNADSLPEALDFYRKVGEEISAACAAGEIACIDRKPSIKPVWKAKYIKYIPKTFWDIFKQAVTFRFFKLSEREYEKWRSTASKEMVEDYRFVTREKIVPAYRHQIASYPDYYKHMIVEKFRIKVDIGNSYKLITPVLFVMAVLAHMFFLVQSLRNRQFDFATTFGFVLLGGIISLVSILTYVKITLWGINRPLLSAYPLVLYYITFIAISTHNYIKNKMFHTNTQLPS